MKKDFYKIIVNRYDECSLIKGKDQLEYFT